MDPDITQTELLPNHRLKRRFANSEEKEFDVSPYLDKGVFSELRDETYFKSVRVAFGAVEWPNDRILAKTHFTFWAKREPNFSKKKNNG